MHAALISLPRFIISHTDGAETLYTKQRGLFGCSHHSHPWKKRWVCPEDESCNWEKHPHNKETTDFCFEITNHSHVFDYQSVILLFLLLLYLIHKQCCSTDVHPLPQWYLLFTAAFLCIHYILKALSSNHPEFHKWCPCSICLSGVHRNFILKYSNKDQVCDETLSLSHCPVSPHTAGIITDFAKYWCHQSSKPTSQTSLY